MELSEFSDRDFRATILRALWWLTGLTVAALPLVLWRLGWRSAVLLVIGSAISGSGLWEWLRLLTAVMRRMDASEAGAPPPSLQAAQTGGAGEQELRAEAISGDAAGEEVPEAARAEARRTVRPLGLVFFGFGVRLVVVLLVLYGSLKLLGGSAIAVAIGLGLGVFALTIEGLRLVKAWTV